jgi:transposase
MAPWLGAAAYPAVARVQHIGADMAERGQRRRTWVTEACGWTLAIVERPRRWGGYPVDVEPPPMPAFTVLPRRWVVESRHLYYPYPDKRLLSYYWSVWIVASRRRHRKVPASSRGRERERMLTHVLPPRP